MGQEIGVAVERYWDVDYRQLSAIINRCLKVIASTETCPVAIFI
jgi:hypothetical protein